MKGLRKRELTESDNDILIDATLTNLNWLEPRFTSQDIVSRPEFAHYATLDSSRGDFGIAVLDEGWVGVAWVLFLPPEDPGYGYVEVGDGELSVSVKRRARRCGIGRELMLDIIGMARRRGHNRLTLSVERGNPAVNLYRELGFIDVDPVNHPGTMLLSWQASTQHGDS